MLLKIDNRTSRINVTAKAQTSMAALEVGQSVRGRRRDVVGAVNRFEPIPGTAQTRWLARGTIAGKDVVVLLERHAGDPWNCFDNTVRINDVFDPSEADSLLALGKGLAPLLTSKKALNDANSNDD